MVVAGILAISCLNQDAQALDWPRWRGPDLNGISRETGWSTTWPASGPKQLWKANVGVGFSSIAVSQGRTYLMGNRNKQQDVVYCLDAVTGKEVWHHAYDAPLEPNNYEGGPSATPTVDGDRVYTLSKQGLLLCLDAATGKLVWSNSVPEAVGAFLAKSNAAGGKSSAELKAAKPEWGFAGSVLVVGERLYVNVGKNGTALDKAGKVVWVTGPEPAGYSTFVPFTIGNRSGLALLALRAVVGVDPGSGKELWSYPWKTRYDVNAADPIIDGDLVFVSSGYDHGATVVRITGTQAQKVWENRNMRNHFNSCVLIDGSLYGFDESDLRCLDFKTGVVKWTEEGLGKGALMAADGKLIVLSEKGELVVAPATPAGFKPVARAQVLGGKCWTTPVLANGRIYCRNAAGDTVCVDVSK